MSKDGVKHDAGKLRYDLVPPAALRGLVSVVTFGAGKYGAGNWKQLEHAKPRYFAALMRHGWAWFAGEKNDPETGMPHLWHLLCNAAFLAQLEAEEEDSDGTENRAQHTPVGEGQHLQGVRGEAGRREGGEGVPDAVQAETSAGEGATQGVSGASLYPFVGGGLELITPEERDRRLKEERDRRLK